MADAPEGDPTESPSEPADLDELLTALHEHLAATQERPVERSASRWIGEAEAVARDLADADLADPVIAERLGHVRSLLAEVEDTEDAEAQAHVEEARALARQALDALEGT